MIETVVLKNKVTYETIKIDMLTTPDYVLEAVDWGNAESIRSSYKYINQTGAYIAGISLDTRKIAISGWVIAENQSLMTDRKKLLNRFCNPKQLIQIIYGKNTIEFYPDTSIKYSINYVENNEVVCKFKIDGLCPNPLFESVQENKLELASTQPMFNFPLIIPASEGKVFALREPSLIASIENKGDIESGMKLVFKAKGTLKNPSLFDIKTQKFFKIDKTMVAGETVTINTNDGQKKITGMKNGVQENYFKYRNWGSDWLKLQVGTNSYRYDADEGLDNLEVYLYFNEKYLEVQ